MTLAQLYGSYGHSRIPVTRSTKPRENWVFFPTVGLYGEAAAASQTSRSGEDIDIARNRCGGVDRSDASVHQGGLSVARCRRLAAPRDWPGGSSHPRPHVDPAVKGSSSAGVCVALSGYGSPK